MLIKSSFLFTSILSVATAVAQPASPVNFSMQEGMLSDMVYGILVDADGFIWFGTDAGLSTFDGYSFTNYTMDDGLPDHEIINLFEDSQYRIWMRTINGKVGFIKEGVVHSSVNGNLPASLDFNSKISGIGEDREGNIWISSKYDGIREYTKTGKTEFILGPGEVFAFMMKNPTGQGFLVFGQRILFIDENKLTKTLFTGLRSNSVGRNGAHHGKIYFVDSKEKNTLFQYDPENQRLDTLVHSAERIYNIRSVDGQLTLLTSDGIIFCDDQSEEKNRWLRGTAAADMVKDPEGNYWVTSLQSGLFFIPKYHIEVLYPTKTDDSEIHTLGVSDRGEVWFGNKNGVYAIDSTLKTRKKYTINATSVNKIHFDSFENNWIAYDFGLFINGEKIKLPYQNTTGRMLCNYQDKMVFSTKNTIYLLDKVKNTMNLYMPEHFLNADSIKPFSNLNVMAPGKGDSLFIGTGQGLFLYDNGTVSNLSRHDPRLNGRIYDIKTSRFGLWVATSHAGLICIRENSAQQYDKNNYLPTNLCKSIYIADSTVWVGTNEGLVKLEVKEENVKVSLLAKYNGLPANQVNCVVGVKDRIFVATPGGVATFLAGEVFEEDQDIPLFIREMSADDKAVKSVDKNHYELEPGVNNLRIKYTGLSYKSMGDIRYQYRLLRDTADVVPWQTTGSREVSIWNPQAGEHYFQVRAKKLNGSYTDPLSIRIKVSAYLWETWWFIATALCLFVLSGWLVIGAAYKARQRKKELLMNSVSSEIKALRSQLNPHFMFNALNSIKSFILNNEQNDAEEYLTRFSKLMRLTLRYSEKTMTSIEKEVELLSLYLEMEMLRVSDKFRYTIRIDPAVDKTANIIPSMIVQPFVENAIWHGLLQKDNDRRLDIHFLMKDKYLTICVEDNGVGFRKSGRNEDSSGIRLIQDRLKLMEKYYRSKIRCELLSLEDGIKGTLVKLEIPVL